MMSAAFIGLSEVNIGLLLANDATAFHDSTYPRASSSLPLYVAQQATAAAFYVSLAVGLIDAFVWSPSRGQARVEATVIPNAHGAGAVAAFSF